MEDLTVRLHGTTSFITAQSFGHVLQMCTHTHTSELMLAMCFYLKQPAETVGGDSTFYEQKKAHSRVFHIIFIKCWETVDDLLM